MPRDKTAYSMCEKLHTVCKIVYTNTVSDLYQVCVQTEVSLAVNWSQSMISNFENLYLSFKSMHKMKPQLQTWLDEMQSRVILDATLAPRP